MTTATTAVSTAVTPAASQQATTPYSSLWNDYVVSPIHTKMDFFGVKDALSFKADDGIVMKTVRAVLGILPALVLNVFSIVFHAYDWASKCCSKADDTSTTASTTETATNAITTPTVTTPTVTITNATTNATTPTV